MISRMGPHEQTTGLHPRNAKPQQSSQLHNSLLHGPGSMGLMGLMTHSGEENPQAANLEEALKNRRNKIAKDRDNIPPDQNSNY